MHRWKPKQHSESADGDKQDETASTTSAEDKKPMEVLQNTSAAMLAAITKAGATRHVVATTATALLRTVMEINATEVENQEIAWRTHAVQQAMLAHDSLRKLGGHGRCLGTATCSAH